MKNDWYCDVLHVKQNIYLSNTDFITTTTDGAKLEPENLNEKQTELSTFQETKITFWPERIKRCIQCFSGKQKQRIVLILSRFHLKKQFV